MKSLRFVNSCLISIFDNRVTLITLMHAIHYLFGLCCSLEVLQQGEHEEWHSAPGFASSSSEAAVAQTAVQSGSWGELPHSLETLTASTEALAIFTALVK